MSILFTTLLALAPSNQDPAWGGFRGNNGAGLATGDAALPEKLDREANQIWRTELPKGYSSPVVAGGRVFLTGAEDKRLLTLCFDAETGEKKWRKSIEYDGSRVGANSAAAPTPATDGERVYALFHHIGLVAYGLDGEEQWRNGIGAPFDLPHGLAASPVVHADRIVVQLDEDDESHLIALDKKTGKELWKVARASTHGYSTPIVYVPEEGPAQVIASGALQLAAYSLEDGEKLWWVNGSAWQVKAVPVLHGDLCIVNAYMVPSSEFGAPRLTQTWEELRDEKDGDGDGLVSKEEWPVEVLHQAWFIFDLDGDGKIDQDDYEYLVRAGTATGALYAVRLGGKGDVTDSHVAWRYEKRRGMSDVISPLVVGETLFLLRDGGLLTAMDAASGKLGKQERVGSTDMYFASPVTDGERILTVSLSGDVSVLSGKADWEVLSTVEMDEQIWSTPAIVGDRVYLRSQAALYCFGDNRE
ncbi:MAG: PQQ-binding-like beta-propeller repeat protein [bacterium]|nr:PQQ-binding-like beta-propeller repeat protein [bacterium]